MYSTIEHDGEHGLGFPSRVSRMTDADTFTQSKTETFRTVLAPAADTNAEALRLVAESRNRDRLRRQEKRERVYSVIGSVLGWLLFVALVLTVVGMSDGWGFIFVALDFCTGRLHN